jgi:hypothetical protein
MCAQAQSERSISGSPESPHVRGPAEQHRGVHGTTGVGADPSCVEAEDVHRIADEGQVAVRLLS